MLAYIMFQVTESHWISWTTISIFYKLTNFGGPHESGDVISALDTEGILICVLHVGARGPDTGVRPVPPTIKDSKLNWMPVEGVEIEIPGKSVIVFADCTSNVRGLHGLGRVGIVWLSIIFLDGGWKDSSSSGICSTNSVFTRSWTEFLFKRGKSYGFISCGLGDLLYLQ